MDRNSPPPPPPRLHRLVNRFIHVRTAVDGLQDTVRSPGDEDRLPGAVQNAFFAADNNWQNSNTGATANGYYQNQPHEHAGKPIVFYLKTNPQDVMQATVVYMENDTVLYVKDVTKRGTSQPVSQVKYFDKDIEVLEFDASNAATGQHMSSPASRPQPFTHTSSGSFPQGSGHSTFHAGMGGSQVTQRCGWCRDILMQKYCTACFRVTPDPNSSNCHTNGCYNHLSSYCSQSCHYSATHQYS